MSQAERRGWSRPPTPEEVDAFLKDTSSNAYEKQVERLLASPHYGERWGRHWLDVIRFGESRGYERNEIITNLWPFRDYIISWLPEGCTDSEFVIAQYDGAVAYMDACIANLFAQIAALGLTAPVPARGKKRTTGVPVAMASSNTMPKLSFPVAEFM